MKNKIIVCGDIHGVWSGLNSLINKENPDIILQCGDFGFWDNFHGKPSIVTDSDTRYFQNKQKNWYLYDQIKNPCTQIYWCDGNHENHETLLNLSNNEVMPNVFYQKRGSVITLPDGRNVLFIGGAMSIDKNQRRQGIDWFPEEIISYGDIDFALNNCKKYDKIDIVISHTCPMEFNLDSKIKYYMIPKVSDTCRKMLSVVLNEVKPENWFFGHWHLSLSNKYKNCNWTALNMATETNWWIEL